MYKLIMRPNFPRILPSRLDKNYYLTDLGELGELYIKDEVLLCNCCATEFHTLKASEVTSNDYVCTRKGCSNKANYWVYTCGEL